MNNKLLKILAVLIISVIILLLNDYYSLSVFYFYTLSTVVLFDILVRKKITLLHIWNIAFVFIILSEVFTKGISSDAYILKALKFLVLANNLIYVGYISKNDTNFHASLQQAINVKSNTFTKYFLILLVVIYTAFTIKGAINAFLFGRNVSVSTLDSDSYIFVALIINSLGLVLPAFIAYYYVNIRKRGLLMPLILSSPVFIILFFGGTRFYLLFSFLGFMITILSEYSYGISIKKAFMVGITIIILMSLSSLMKEFRVSGSRGPNKHIENPQAFNGFPEYLSQFMSPEGVVDMTSLMFRHFEKNDFLYGKSSSFILYFWIPRAIWPDKPTMLGHWLIRKYRSGFSIGQSTSFGFSGELYADFGLLSLFFVFLLGRLLKLADDYKEWAFNTGGYQIIVGSMLFPYVFFFVRSPITATQVFLGILFFYIVIKKLIFKAIKN